MIKICQFIRIVWWQVCELSLQRMNLNVQSVSWNCNHSFTRHVILITQRMSDRNKKQPCRDWISHRHGCTINWTWSIRWHGTGLRRVDAHAGNPPIGIRRFHLLNSYSRNGPQITSFHNTASVSATVVLGNFFTVVSSSCCVYMIYTHYHVNSEAYFNSNFSEIHFLGRERYIQGGVASLI